MAKIDSTLIAVKTYSNLFDAEVAQTALEAAGIECMVRSDDGGGMRPGLWMGNGVDLVVRKEDVQRATEVLDTPAEPAEPPSR